MGTRFQIRLYADSEAQAKAAADKAFARVQELNAIFSDYEADSELMEFCHQPAGTPVKLSPELFEILSQSQELAQKSDGAFDVTLGPVIRLWRLSRRDGRLPTEEALQEAFAKSGHEKLILDPEEQTGTLTVEGMRLTLGGIAKGWAADEALQLLRDAGLPQALVAASGDIALGDPPPGENGWRVGLNSILSPEEPDYFLELANAAVSTSGDTQQFVEIDGKRYSHIVNPKTGLGLIKRRSVSVVAPRATLTDSLATCISVLNDIDSLSLNESTHGVRIVELDGEAETYFGRLDGAGKALPASPR